jgi:hypothetical protein
VGTRSETHSQPGLQTTQETRNHRTVNLISTDLDTAISDDSKLSSVTVSVVGQSTKPVSLTESLSPQLSASPATRSLDGDVWGTSVMILSVEAVATDIPDELPTERFKLKNRQSQSGFVGNYTGQSPDNCSDATIFHQKRGQLLHHKRAISVDPGVDYINISDYPDGSISTTFSVVHNILVWTNETFFNGHAGFCQGPSNEVYVTFTDNGGPDWCSKQLQFILDLSKSREKHALPF